MKVFMTGGTGFVGTYLTKKLIDKGHNVCVLTQSLTGRELKIPGLTYLVGDPNVRGKWQDAVRDHEIIVNLAGASIFSRWTDEQKILRDSASTPPGICGKRSPRTPPRFVFQHFGGRVLRVS